jgi:hypothetical protein
MFIPPQLQSLIEQLNEQITEIEQEATEGLNILRRVMSQFPESVILVQYFAYLNTLLLFVETSRRQIETITATLLSGDVPIEVIQETGEDLGTLLGRTIEVKMRVERIYDFLGGLP